MSIVIIGSGNLATHLSLALKAAGYTISQVFSRTEQHAQELAEKLSCNYTSHPDEIDKNASIYILSVKDDAIGDIAAHICPYQPEALFIHTAGSVPMDVFKKYARHYGVLYPMQTFSKHFCRFHRDDSYSCRLVSLPVPGHVVLCD